MPPRTPPPYKSLNPTFPPSDAATYRDLLMFEERLKTTAANLQHRKAKYQLFLAQLLLAIALLLIEVFLPPDSSLFAVPYRFALHKLLPNYYPPDNKALPHPYIATGLLFVSVTTLVLFFASGMYAEKIAYANKYVPHANRALRSFNIYLNMRQPPLRSKFPSYLNPVAFFFPRPPSQPSSSSPPSTPTLQKKGRPRSASTSRPIAPIPPATNPRGELIFSSRVDRSFRESYERYRAAFERRREEKSRAERKRWIDSLWLWRKQIPRDVPATPGRTVSGSGSVNLRGRAGTPKREDGEEGIVMRRSGTPGSNVGTPRRGTPSSSPTRRSSTPSRHATVRDSAAALSSSTASPSRQGSVQERRDRREREEGELSLRASVLLERRNRSGSGAGA